MPWIQITGSPLCHMCRESVNLTFQPLLIITVVFSLGLIVLVVLVFILVFMFRVILILTLLSIVILPIGACSFLPSVPSILSTLSTLSTLSIMGLLVLSGFIIIWRFVLITCRLIVVILSCILVGTVRFGEEFILRIIGLMGIMTF